MLNNNLKIEEIGYAVHIEINRPKALNALNKAVFEELERFFQTDYNKYSRLDGVVPSGAGEKAFAAGADIAELATLDKKSAVELVARGHRVFGLIENFHRPVVAAVDGFALGGGCELAMACHLRLATPSVRFGLPELGLGLIPGYGGTQRLVRYIGRTKAMEYILTSAFIDASTAERLGLVNKVVERENLIKSATDMISVIGAKGPKAVTYAIRCLNAHVHHERGGFEKEKELFAELTQSGEAREGLSAFLEKRKPEFWK